MEKLLFDYEFNFTLFVTLISVSFLLILIISIIVNRKKIKFYSLIMREGRISKIGISFIFFLYAIIYQAIVYKNITPGLTEVFILTLLLELGDRGIDVIGYKYGYRRPHYDYTDYNNDYEFSGNRKKIKENAKINSDDMDFDKF